MSWKNPSDLSRVWTREPWISNREHYPETTETDITYRKFDNIPLLHKKIISLKLFRYCNNIISNCCNFICETLKHKFWTNSIPWSCCPRIARKHLYLIKHSSHLDLNFTDLGFQTWMILILMLATPAVKTFAKIGYCLEWYMFQIGGICEHSIVNNSPGTDVELWNVHTEVFSVNLFLPLENAMWFPWRWKYQT